MSPTMGVAPRTSSRLSADQSGNAVQCAAVDYGCDDAHRLDSAAYRDSQLDPNGVETFTTDLLGNRTLRDDTRDRPTKGSVWES